jgi:hypothetical protein
MEIIKLPNRTQVQGMKQMPSALIIGGGAIGRGFIPWALADFEVDNPDASHDLVNGKANQGGLYSFMMDGEQLQEKWIQVRRISTSFEELKPVDSVRGVNQFLQRIGHTL